MRENGERERLELDAYHDGELSWLARRRVERRLARDAAARREVASLAELGVLLREHESAQPAPPDLWAGVRAQLATARRPERLEADDALPARAGWLPAWLGAGLAAASVAAVMASGALAGDARPVSSVRWLDGKGKPVMVLQDDRDATIIWVFDQPEQSSSGGAHDAMV
jgi:anti-sigma factor RsiW